jgi:hypothetical protein
MYVISEKDQKTNQANQIKKIESNETIDKANPQTYSRIEIGIICAQGLNNAGEHAKSACGGFWGGVHSTKFSCTGTTPTSVTVNGWYMCNK